MKNEGRFSLILIKIDITKNEKKSLSFIFFNKFFSFIKYVLFMYRCP